MRQTRFREATVHFVRGAIDPRVLVSYFDELRPALFSEPLGHEKDGSTTLRGVEGDFVEVEVWVGVREYMPDETSVDDISKSVRAFPFLPSPPLACHFAPPLPTSHLKSTRRQLNSPSSLSSHVSHFSSLPYHLQRIKLNDVWALTLSRHQLSPELFSLLASWRNTRLTSRG